MKSKLSIYTYEYMDNEARGNLKYRKRLYFYKFNSFATGTIIYTGKKKQSVQSVKITKQNISYFDRITV